MSFKYFNSYDQKGLLIHFALILVGSCFYVNLLVECPFDSQTECLNGFINPNIDSFFFTMFLVVFIFTYLVIRSAQDNFFKLCITLATIYFLQNFETRVTLQIYGGGARLIFLFFLSVGVIFSGLCKLIYRYMNKIMFSIFILCVMAFSFHVYYGVLKTSCNTWDKGISGSIQNYGELCRIPKPDICMSTAIEGLLNFAKFGNCDNRDHYSKEVLEKYYLTNKTFIGLAKTSEWGAEDRAEEEIQDRVMHAARGYDSLEEAYLNGHELVVDSDQMKLNIKIQRNQSLVEERNKIINDGLNQNIVIIYIDALSRAAAHRKLPISMEWFKKRKTYEFFRYHAYRGETYDNGQALIFGTRSSYLKQPPTLSQVTHHNILDSFKEGGFITGHVGNTETLWTIHVRIQEVKEHKIADLGPDHEGSALAQDPYYQNPDSPLSLMEGINSIFMRCQYQKQSFQHIFDYSKQFLNSYSDQKTALYIEFMDQHEFTGESLKLMDSSLREFLESLQANTTVVMVADHGFHMRGLSYLLKQKDYDEELALPLLMMTEPPNLTPTQKKNLEDNQQKLVSAMETNNFLKFLASGKEPTSGLSLVSSIPENRSCKDIEADICGCFN